MGLPEIRVEFSRLAETAARRSARGFLAIILRDATEGVTWTTKDYKWISEVREADFTSANYAMLARAFAAQPARVTVVRVGTSGTVADAAPLLKTVAYNWICAPYADMQADLADYVKEINTPRRVRKAKALVYNQAADDLHVVSVANETVTLLGETTVRAMVEYLPRLAGILAACPMTQSVTSYALDDLAAVAAVPDPDAAVDAGKLVLHLDDDTIRIARGVTTLQTVLPTLTEDMKKIAVVEAMDMIQEDIIRVFKNNYLAKVRNSADNQALFVSDVLLYLRDLETEGILDTGSTAAIDVDAMRKAWEAEGRSVVDLEDEEVRAMTYKSYVFVAASIRILDAMEDLRMTIGLG